MPEMTSPSDAASPVAVSSVRSFASARVSSRDTCACESPTSLAICRSVRSAWKRRKTIWRSRSSSERMLDASSSRSSLKVSASPSTAGDAFPSSEEIDTERRARSAISARSISLSCTSSALASSSVVGRRPSVDSSSLRRRQQLGARLLQRAGSALEPSDRAGGGGSRPRLQAPQRWRRQRLGLDQSGRWP